MALTTYAELLAGVRNWLARPGDSTTMPDTDIADMIAFAEDEIYSRLRLRQMETAADLTVNAQTEALPSDFIEMRRLYLDGTPIYWLEYRAPPQFWVEASANIPGRPRIFTVEGNNLMFAPAPDMTYTGKLFYYARPAALASAVNAIFTARPSLFLYGALSHASPYIGDDDRLPLWKGRFEEIMALTQGVSDRGAYGSSPLRIRNG